jgi:uncharacterized protein YjbI with pentapeptide repeats
VPRRVRCQNRPVFAGLGRWSDIVGAVNREWVRRQLKLRATRGGVRHAPRLWPVWIAAPVALVVASALGWVLYQHVQSSPAVRGAAPVEVVKTTLTLMVALGAVLTGVYAYRKQRLGEGDAARADADQLTQRYSTAAEQLGHDKAAVRLAGVFAMARLADDWQKHRQECIDVLCAYLRMQGEPDVGLSEREVRATIVRTIALHLRDHSVNSWVGHDFDFTGVALNEPNFNSVTFSGDDTIFDGATFSGKRTWFMGATFSGASISFVGASFSGDTSFYKAKFSGKYTGFYAATFAGNTDFDGAVFSGKNTSFAGAVFSGGTTADEATAKASFVGQTVDWGPITPRQLPSPALATH